VAIETPPLSECDLLKASPQLPVARVACHRPFRYIDDPICVGCMMIYVLNRWVLKPHHIGGWLVHDYLNDILCLPIFVPIILRLQSALHIRRHHLPPTFFETMHNWAIFSVLYYFVFPRLPAFSSVADPMNSVAYLLGGIAAYVCWQFYYLLPI
jgi:hypothetical protein